MLIKKQALNNNNRYTVNVPIHDIDGYNSFNFNTTSRVKKYFSEIVIITNCKNSAYINEWLFWHLNIIHFDHIVLVDNTNDGCLKTTAEKFNNVYYIHKSGVLKQTEIYNHYVNNSDAEWVLPIDDDEFLYVSDKYNNNINLYINHLLTKCKMYKYSFCWHMMFSKTLYEKNPSNNIVKNYPYFFTGNESPLHYVSFNSSKTIVNTQIKHYYCNENKPVGNITLNNLNNNDNHYTYAIKRDYTTYNTIGGIHNPISKSNNIFYYSYNEETNNIHIDGYNNYKLSLNADCYLAHFKYRSLEDWNSKILNFKFPDISETYKTLCYTDTKINEMYNVLNDKNLVFDQNMNRLSKKYDY